MCFTITCSLILKEGIKFCLFYRLTSSSVFHLAILQDENFLYCIGLLLVLDLQHNLHFNIVCASIQTLRFYNRLLDHIDKNFNMLDTKTKCVRLHFKLIKKTSFLDTTPGFSMKQIADAAR